MSSYEEITILNERIEECNAQLDKLQSELKTLKESHWSFNSDEKDFGDLTIECNLGSWQETKRNRKDGKIFYLEVRDSTYDESVEFNLEEAKMLVKYISEKITFMES